MIGLLGRSAAVASFRISSRNITASTSPISTLFCHCHGLTDSLVGRVLLAAAHYGQHVKCLRQRPLISSGRYCTSMAVIATAMNVRHSDTCRHTSAAPSRGYQRIIYRWRYICRRVVTRFQDGETLPTCTHDNSRGCIEWRGQHATTWLGHPDVWKQRRIPSSPSPRNRHTLTAACLAAMLLPAAALQRGPRALCMMSCAR
ncbi:hypothetical protein N656DRAFT_568178 [Canariomyces notabilis]|uniref:Uncharacterized protein n=1 Tax=Canariomyces notabilis TaxID=2074819 RepID=A0AAN6TGL9_9PEZI|nr:hypothetical protein N656DRAFT_568178 [Canariomyces arenarius]